MLFLTEASRWFGHSSQGHLEVGITHGLSAMVAYYLVVCYSLRFKLFPMHPTLAKKESLLPMWSVRSKKINRFSTSNRASRSSESWLEDSLIHITLRSPPINM